ncbi:MAG TPA: type I asparaginase [Bacteroidia bacterium]|nr:type I asparaginase [Bacteroidia bacterium]
MAKRPSILLIYTGGTIGMIRDPKSGQLKPFNFLRLLDEIPELSKFNINIQSHSFREPIDSSDMQPETWVELAHLVEQEYRNYDGFVILHGSDTMAYTASALSFMLENLAKPVVLTGSQLPIGTIRTDGKENLITAIEIAAAQIKGKAIVPEVCVYFEYRLYRGNRTNKFNAEHFRAFHSPNYPLLAEAGVHINYNTPKIAHVPSKKLKIHTLLDKQVAILKMFPGITAEVVHAILNAKGIRAIVLETYGSGNVTTEKWFIAALEQAIKNGKIILNITQCAAGRVEQGRYQTSAGLAKIGVVGGADMTTEAAITKLMFLLGSGSGTASIKKQLSISLRGELTPA